MKHPCPFHEGGMAVGKKWIITLAAALLLLGLGVLLYPTVSSAVNHMNGSYAIQDHGEMIIRKITGDYDNIVGLPAARLEEALGTALEVC